MKIIFQYFIKFLLRNIKDFKKILTFVIPTPITYARFKGLFAIFASEAIITINKKIKVC